MTEATCDLCGEPMPKGEEMFKLHGYSGPCPKPPLERPTLEKYLQQNLDNDVIDHSIRCVRGPNGEVDFYIHPSGVDGETLNLTVKGNDLTIIPDNHGAGSRPPESR